MLNGHYQWPGLDSSSNLAFGSTSSPAMFPCPLHSLIRDRAIPAAGIAAKPAGSMESEVSSSMRSELTSLLHFDTCLSRLRRSAACTVFLLLGDVLPKPTANDADEDPERESLPVESSVELGL